uniref:Uncharacterized protein LOC102803021 n=1 Tax=Saccoglossus kowalevskii TaxID=10224 RepID=A0ABM0MKD0_SACKO|nr:PREDICTED: uncharacterized protein LOC102803021 [Saccoglossus kowalevskii]
MAAAMLTKRGNCFAGLTRNHGVRCESVSGINIEAYVSAISEIIDAKTILAASRINGSVIVFLTSVADVDKVCANGLNVGDMCIHAEALVKPATKIVLSGVPPFITNATLDKHLNKFGRIVSTFRYIPIGIKNPELRHIKSFRRQVHMISENDSIEDIILIKHENRLYKIYVSTDKITCYKCFKKGHVQRDCRQGTRSQNKTNAAAENSQQSTNNTPNDENNQPTVETNGYNVDENTQSAPRRKDENKTDEHHIDGIEYEDRTETVEPSQDYSQSRDDDMDVGGDNTQITRLFENDLHTDDAGDDAGDDVDNDSTNNVQTDSLSTSSDFSNTSEEVVLTHPSTILHSSDPGFCVPSYSSIVSGSKPIDVFDRKVSDLDGRSDDRDEMESLSSEVSELSEVSTDDADLKLLDQDTITSFIQKSYNHKRIIEFATEFCPDLGILIKSINHYRKNTDMPGSEKIRIQRMNSKLTSYYKKVLKNPETTVSTKEKAKEVLLNTQRGIPSNTGGKQKI